MSSNNLVDRLMAVVNEAKRDGKITSDEYNILKQLSLDAAEYSLTLEEAKRDGVIDEYEEEALANLKEKLMSNAKNVAEQDGEITEEELKLLTKITNAVKSNDS